MMVVVAVVVVVNIAKDIMFIPIFERKKMRNKTYQQQEHKQHPYR